MLRLSTSALRGEADIPDPCFSVCYLTQSGHGAAENLTTHIGSLTSLHLLNDRRLRRPSQEMQPEQGAGGSGLGWSVRSLGRCVDRP